VVTWRYAALPEPIQKLARAPAYAAALVSAAGIHKKVFAAVDVQHRERGAILVVREREVLVP
jgi:hypothetical protein